MFKDNKMKGINEICLVNNNNRKLCNYEEDEECLMIRLKCVSNDNFIDTTVFE